MSSPLTVATISYAAGDKLVWGRATTKVRAPIEEVLAFFWNTNARNQHNADTVERSYLDEPNSHNRLQYYLQKFPSPYSNRLFWNRFVWRTLDEKLVLTSMPTIPESGEVESATQRANTLRTTKGTILRPSGGWHFGSKDSSARTTTLGMSKRVTKMTKGDSKNDEADVVMVIHFDFGGTKALPKFVSEYYAGSKLCDYDGKDGVAIGEAFMSKIKLFPEQREVSKHQVST